MVHLQLLSQEVGFSQHFWIGHGYVTLCKVQSACPGEHKLQNLAWKIGMGGPVLFPKQCSVLAEVK